MASKRKILEALTRTALLDIAGHYEITGLTAKSKADIVDALAGSRKVQPEEFLTLFGRDDLKGICQSLGLDESGREKQVLIDRLMGRDTETNEPQATAIDTRQAMAKKKPKTDLDDLNVEDYRHSGAKRTNIPPAKIAAEGTVPAMQKIEYSYSPRRPPVLRFDTSGKADQLPELLRKATKGPLVEEEVQILAEALRTQQPWLEWAGKKEAESKGFNVDPLALHIHERVSSQAILKVAARQDVERTLFSDPEQEYHEAVQFYQHDIDWTNRLILGDSLQVMASLAYREDLAGKIQMIYIDPPYGVKFRSNFQPEIRKRTITETDNDLTREPEMVKAYRDTWHLGLHSYLKYLRDRLIACRALLAESGSTFIQISDDNLHHVREVADDVFGPDNFVCLITFRKTGGEGGTFLGTTCDFILWYAKNRSNAKFHRLYHEKQPGDEGATEYTNVELPDGSLRPMTKDEIADPTSLPVGSFVYATWPIVSPGYSEKNSVPITFGTGAKAITLKCPGNKHWSVGVTGTVKLWNSGRILPREGQRVYKRYLADFAATPLSNQWVDSRGDINSQYVVQTSSIIIQRCMLMTTDPGDLILDPTSGGGTSAIVAEQWGRRWIAIDTSRVAVFIARQRLMASSFPYYALREDVAGVSGGFKNRTLPYISFGAIARNTGLDPILAKHQHILDSSLNTCKEALGKVTQEVRFKLDAKLIYKQRKDGKRSITDADNRRWQLPKMGEKFEHWTVPFDTDPDWPKELQQAVKEYRKVWRAKMEQVNTCIADNADQEELVDQPEVVKGIVRVSGPFTVEAVQPPERSLGAFEGMFDVVPEELEDTFDMKNVESYLDQMTRLLKLDGVRFPNNKEMALSRLERLTGQAGGLHAEGRWLPKGETDDDPEGKATVAVGFGPQYGPITAKQVEDLIRSASRRGYDALVVAGFSFDGPAQAAIEEAQHPKLHIHMAHIRPDINPGMAGLLKDQKGSQLFSVFGQPRTRLQGPDKKNDYVVHMEGVDIYDPVANTIRSTEDSKVAAWFVDGDYDGRTFCITQAFFPDKSAWDKLAKALGGVVSEDAFEKLSGIVSLPFPAGKHKCVAVKVIDPRGNEVMQIHRIG